MINTLKLDKDARIKIAVTRYTGTFPRGILVEITNCQPDEPLEVQFYAGMQHLNTMIVIASHNGEAHVSLNWKPNTQGRVHVCSKVNNDAAEIRF